MNSLYRHFFINWKVIGTFSNSRMNVYRKNYGASYVAKHVSKIQYILKYKDSSFYFHFEDDSTSYVS